MSLQQHLCAPAIHKLKMYFQPFQLAAFSMVMLQPLSITFSVSRFQYCEKDHNYSSECSPQKRLRYVTHFGFVYCPNPPIQNGTMQCHNIDERSECPSLSCEERWQIRPMGKCCKVCRRGKLLKPIFVVVVRLTQIIYLHSQEWSAETQSNWAQTIYNITISAPFAPAQR